MPKSFAMSKSTNFTRTWCAKWDSWRWTSTRSKMSLEQTSNITSWENMLRLEMKSYRSSTGTGKRNSLSLKTKVWSGSRSLSTSMRSKWTFWTSNLIVLFGHPRSNHHPNSRRCRIMRNLLPSTRGWRRPWTTGRSSRSLRSMRHWELRTLDKRMLANQGKLCWRGSIKKCFNWKPKSKQVVTT